MNTIIWWLESPWQLRALVFILSFFVCFVGPWLHSQSLLASRVARKPLEENSGAALAPKVEGLLKQPEQSEGLAKEKAPPPSAEAEVKGPAGKAHAGTEAAVHEAQAPAGTVVRPNETPAAVPVEAGPAQIAAIPAEVEGEQARSAAPVAAAPAFAPAERASEVSGQAVAKHEDAAPVQTPDERATAPVMRDQEQAPPEAAPLRGMEAVSAASEAEAPAKQEEAAVQAPAPSAASPAQFAGGFRIVSQSINSLPVPLGRPVDKQDLAVSTEKGGSADVDVYVLSDQTGWDLRRPNRVASKSNGRAELSAVLDSDVFAKAAARYDTVACVGLGSREAGLSRQDITRLIEKGAVDVCGIIARKPYVSTNTRLYGAPLEQHLKSTPTEKEKAQRSLIIIGIRNAKNDLADPAAQRKMVSEIIRSGKIVNLPLGDPSEVALGKELRYIEVKRGTTSRNSPVKTSTVKPGYAALPHALRKPVPRQKPAADRVAFRHIPKEGARKVSRSHVSSEPFGSKAHSGCRLFDFPF